MINHETPQQNVDLPNEMKVYELKVDPRTTVALRFGVNARFIDTYVEPTTRKIEGAGYSIVKENDGTLRIRSSLPLQIMNAQRKWEMVKEQGGKVVEDDTDARRTTEEADAQINQRAAAAISALKTKIAEQSMDATDVAAANAIALLKSKIAAREALTLRDISSSVSGWNSFEATVPTGQAINIGIVGKLSTNFVLGPNVTSRGWNPAKKLKQASQIGYYVERTKGKDGTDTIRIDTPYSVGRFEKIS